jgi:diguanylate cyclase (GGDEF)-like protein
MMDLDELKQINDRYGHFFGDRVLRGVGEVIRAGGRRIDTAARYGGDEFVVLLPETDPTGAYVLAEKIRVGVADLRVDVAGSMIQPSISIGVVGYPEDGRTSDELMITADASMYRSKHAGRNRVSGVPVMDDAVVPVMDDAVVPVMDEAVVARPIAGAPITDGPIEVAQGPVPEPAGARRKRSDKSV